MKIQKLYRKDRRYCHQKHVSIIKNLKGGYANAVLKLKNIKNVKKRKKPFTNIVQHDIIKRK